MAKQEAKPLFSLKSDFYLSLDNFVQQVILFRSAVESALSLDQVNPACAEILKERLEALSKAMMRD